MTYDLDSPAGQVRLLLTDTDEHHPIFVDEEIAAFLSMEGGNVFLGAALALETIAVNETLVLKVIQTLDLKTDGAKVADALLKRAALLRGRADDDASDIDDDFAIAEFADPVFGAREMVAKQFLVP